MESSARLEEQLDGLRREVADLARRVQRLEHASATPVDSPPSPAMAEAAGATAEPAVGPVVSLAGRTLMVFAGAYLLRAVTEAAVVPPLAGVALGLAYAGVWLIQAERSAGPHQRLSAAFHGLTAPVIGFPVVLETTARFELLPPGAAAAVLVALAVAGLVVARRRRLPEVAWAHLLLALGTAVALLRATHQPLVATAAMFALAALVEALTLRAPWPGLRWPAALVLDLGLLLTVALAGWHGGPPSGYPHLDTAAVVATTVGTVALYLGSIAARTVVRRAPASVFDVVQAALVLLLGLGGTAWLTGAHAAVGAVALVLGAACYGAGFTLLERTAETAADFYVCTTFALLLVVAGACLAIPATAVPCAGGALAVLMAGLAARHGRTTLATHTLCYLGCAAAGGLAPAAAAALWGAGDAASPAIAPSSAFVAVSAVACYAMLARGARRPGTPQAMRVPRAGILALAVFSVAGIGASVLTGWTGASADLARLAAERTVLFAGTAVLLAWLARGRALPELAWLVHPVLVAGAFALLVEGLRHGRPLTLFVSFAAYGATLFATPRLLKER